MSKMDPCTNCTVDLEYMPPVRPCPGCAIKAQWDSSRRRSSRSLSLGALLAAQNEAGSLPVAADGALGLVPALEM